MANGHGGKRPGSGRPPGRETTCTSKTTALAQEQAGEGILPLAVMLFDMRRKFEAKDYHGAAERAKDAAPYLHHRLSSVEMEAKVGVQQEVVEELRDATADPPPDDPALPETATLPPE